VHLGYLRIHPELYQCALLPGIVLDHFEGVMFLLCIVWRFTIY